MARSGRGPTSRASRSLVLAALLAACGRPDGSGPPGGTVAGMQLRFEDARQPAAFSRDGLGRREAEGSPAGLWAVVAGLPRPERALVVNLRTGAEVIVALFAARREVSADDIALSPEAAEALGIAEAPVPVRVTALRREPRLVAPEDAF
jgi:hypothetical protein